MRSIAVPAAALVAALGFAVAGPSPAEPAPPLKPRTVWKPVPMPPARLAQTAAYSKRHYGVRTWRLRARVVVQHYSATRSFSATWATFAANAPDRELGELPGTCAHFVVDRDGTIYQLVRLGVRCRHTVGLNHVSIGVEHVAVSDAEVLANRRQLNASIALSRWLMKRYGIELGDVIGHAESLESPFRRERYPAWRCQTHGDFARIAMNRYRERLAAAARAAGVPLGRRVHRVRNRCA